MEPRYFFNFEKLAYVRGDRPPGCILCALRDRLPGVVDLSVAASESSQVCVNLYPFNPGHLLVFPRRHLESLDGLSDAEALDLHRTTRIMVAILRELYRPAGFNLGWNEGAAAGASIPHIHQHLIPRWPGEIGMAELVAGQRVLVEDPRTTAARLCAAVAADGRLTAFPPPAPSGNAPPAE